MSVDRAILALNAGSSSLKFALFELGNSLALTVKGEIENLDTTPHFIARDAKGAKLAETRGATRDFASTLESLLQFVDQHLGEARLGAVGHRVVHGGVAHVEPERVTPALLEALDALIPLDPLHLPHNIAPMRALGLARPGLAQVTVSIPPFIMRCRAKVRTSHCRAR
jgi:acetate kinase